MAESKNTPPTPANFTDADKARARQWFKKGVECREKRDYDYAIECYITGLNNWPEAVEEGHMPLRSLAAQRMQAGGKKPGMMDRLKLQTGGKDAKQAMLNAETLFAKGDAGAAEGVFRNAVRAGYFETAQWIAPLAYEELRKETKPDKSKFKTYRSALIEAADGMEAIGDMTRFAFFLTQAMNSIDFLLSRAPDEELRVEQRHLGGRLTIAQGKYTQADSFRDSIRDAEKQKILHDQDRTKQGEATLDLVIAAAKKEYDENPNVPGKINAYVDALVKTERRSFEDKAIAILDAAFAGTRNYSFKSRADEVRLRQVTRQVRELEKKANESQSEDDQQQVRLARMELNQIKLEVFRDRVKNYPTDSRLKYDFGKALFDAGEFEEAIPVLQGAALDPRSRIRAQFLMGRAFFERENFPEAFEVLKEVIQTGDLPEELLKEAMYWVARAAEAAGSRDEAKAQYGKLLRMDYNYADARKRLDGLK